MADKVRFAPGGARPAPAQVVASTRSELFPGVDRPTMVLWLGLSLIAVSELTDHGPIASVVRAAQGNKQALPTVGDAATGTGMGAAALGIELGLVGFLYVLALVSDNSGTVAVLILVALWVAWLVRHAQTVTRFLAPAANAAPKKGN